jgi:hypothetical protein
VIWQLVAVPGGVEHSSVYLDGNSSNESKVWSHVAGLEVPAHGRRRAKWRVWMSPRTRESSGGTGRSPRVVWLWSQCFHASGGRFGCSGTAALGLHGGGSLGVVVSTLSAPLSTLDHLRGLDTSLWAVVGGSYSCAWSPLLLV